jgi:hypothetical protein
MMTRRAFLKWLLGGGLAMAAGPVYASLVEPRWTEVVRLEVELHGLPKELDGFTIVQLSDLHAGPCVGVRDIKRWVKLANSLEADLVVITGDFVWSSAHYAEACAKELATLRARWGVYAVLGNHDIWTDADSVAESLLRAGIHVLRDEYEALVVGSARLWLVGIEDRGITGITALGTISSISPSDFMALWADARDALTKLLDGIPPDEPRLLLVHNPDFTEMLPGGGVDLALCGHTHGGQVWLPFIGAPLIPSCYGKKYRAGLLDNGATLVYINKGLGLIAPPVRFLCRPEVTLLRLSSGPVISQRRPQPGLSRFLPSH